MGIAEICREVKHIVGRWFSVLTLHDVDAGGNHLSSEIVIHGAEARQLERTLADKFLAAIK